MLLNIFGDIFASFSFNIAYAITVNLLYTAIGRAIFVLFYLLDYGTRIQKKSEDKIVVDVLHKNWRDWAWFVAKEFIWLFVGFLQLGLALAVIAYSVMLAGSHIIAMARRSRFKANLVLGWILGGFLKFFLPIFVLIVYIVILYLDTDSNALNDTVGISAGIALFVVRSLVAAHGRRTREGYTLEESLKAMKKAFARRVPLAVKVVLAAGIVVSPLAMYYSLQATVGMTYTTVYIPTTGGYSLATDIYRTKDAGPQPVVLIRTPYGKGNFYTEGATAYQFVKQGYAVVIQDTRGRYESTDASSSPAMQFLDDYYDGRVTVAWIANQSWCDGNISSYGGSAVGINQYCYADEPTGALKFQDITVASPEIYSQILFPGGAFRKGLIEGWLYSINASNSPTRTPDELTYDLSQIFNQTVMDDTYNITSLSTNDRYANIHASSIQIGGWYDIFDKGIIDGFMGYQYHGGTGALGHNRMIMGPIGHGPFGGLTKALGIAHLTFPNPSFPDQNQWETQMRDAACMGTPIDWSQPCVAYYLMGDTATPTAGSTAPKANQWYTAYQWPLPGVSNVTWYLNANGTLNQQAPLLGENRSYLYNPSDPVHTIGGNNLFDEVPLQPGSLGDTNPAGDDVLNFEGIGPYAQNSSVDNVLNRSDVLVYGSSLLKAPVTVAGDVQIMLNVTTNCTDTAFTAKLMDEYPNGTCFNILDGIQTLSALSGLLNRTAVIPGHLYTITIDLWSTAYQFNTGHRIVLAISSSNYPKYERNPNVFEPLSDHTYGFVIANNTVCSSPITGSALILPELA
jgi:hypothetical protein